MQEQLRKWSRDPDYVVVVRWDDPPTRGPLRIKSAKFNNKKGVDVEVRIMKFFERCFRRARSGDIVILELYDGKGRQSSLVSHRRVKGNG